MSDLISLEAALDAVREAYENEETLDGYEYRLNELPCEEPCEKGKWILKPDEKFHCDKCDGIAPKGIRWSFCPNCGADMRGEQDE